MTLRLATPYRNLKPSSMMAMFKEAATRADVINLSLGEPDVPTAPDIVAAAHRAGLRGATHYAPTRGLPKLRNAISDYWKETYGLCYDPEEEILVTAGGSQACHLAFQALLDPGDEAILLEPYFTFYAQQITYVGGKVKAIPCNSEKSFLPDPDTLEKAIGPKTRILVINSPCNPSGAVFDRETLEGLAEIARRHDIFILSDELYESFVFEGEHLPLANLPGMRERTLTVGGFSKSYAMTGWRIGYAMGPQKLVQTMDVLGTVQTLGVNTMTQHAAVHALENCAPFRDRLASLFRERVHFARKLLDDLPGLKVYPAKGSFYLFVDIGETGLDGDRFARLLLDRAGVVVVPGKAFGESCSRFIRIACTVPNETMTRACERIREVLPSLESAVVS